MFNAESTPMTQIRGKVLYNILPTDATAVSAENTELRSVLSKMAALLRDRNGKCISLDKKIDAMTLQVNSLKEVVALTKDLLNIRNMEVEHLKIDMAAIQTLLDEKKKTHDNVSRLHALKEKNLRQKSLRVHTVCNIFLCFSRFAQWPTCIAYLTKTPSGKKLP